MNTRIALIITPFLFFSGYSYAQEKQESVEQRLQRLERLVNSNGLVDLMVRLESAQSELQRMQGELEVQKHTLEEIKKRQRDLYLDIDRRLLLIERRSGNTGTSSTPVSEPESISAPVATSPATSQTPVIQTQPTSSAVVTTKPANTADELKAYERALDLLKASRYEKAKQALRQFVVDYPNGRYAHIAQFWLAEASYYTRQFPTAIKDYQDLIDKYPNSPKRASALFKIAYSHYELKDTPKAKAVLEQLVQAYPGTTEAGQAENLLQKIRLQNSQ